MNTASAEYMSSLPPRKRLALQSGAGAETVSPCSAGAPPVHPLKLEVEPPVTTLHVAPPAVKKARSALASRGQQAPPSLPGVPSAPPAHAPSSAAAAARAKADLARRLAEAARQRCEAAQTVRFPEADTLVHPTAGALGTHAPTHWPPPHAQPPLRAPTTRRRWRRLSRAPQRRRRLALAQPETSARARSGSGGNSRPSALRSAPRQLRRAL